MGKKKLKCPLTEKEPMCPWEKMFLFFTGIFLFLICVIVVITILKEEGLV